MLELNSESKESKQIAS